MEVASSQYERNKLLKCFRAADSTGRLQLSHCNFLVVPERIWQMELLTRLDLGWNQLKVLPSSIGKLRNLEQLWINHNPISAIPVEIEECKKLKQLDLRNTLITSLPRELSRVKSLIDVDILDVNLKSKLAAAHAAGGTRQLLQKLGHKDLRKNLKQKLEFKLLNVVYREVADVPGNKEIIQKLVKALFKLFMCLKYLALQETWEQKQLIRNCERLFPEQLEEADAAKIKVTFVKLKRVNDKKKLRAEVDLKLRAIYFNTFELKQIENILDGVYKFFPQLEDIQFLLRHATKLFPSEVKEVDCPELFKKMDALRTRLLNERNSALSTLHRALKAMYHDVDPKKVQALLDAIGAVFKKTTDIRKLSADHSTFFPVEFESANARQIRKLFLNPKA